MKTTFLRLLLILIPTFLFAQPNIEQWQFYDGGDAALDHFQDIFPMMDGNYYVVGVSNNNAWLTKLDANCGVLWNILGEDEYSILASVIEADNSDAVVGGVLLNNRGSSIGFLGKRYSSIGENIWDNNFGDGACSSVIELKNGNYVFCGRLDRTGAIICTDANGEVIWSNIYNENGEYSYFHAMRETNGGIVAVGYKTVNDNRLGWIVKVNFAGELIWEQEHREQHGGRSMYYADIVSTENGFYICGNFVQNTFQSFLTKINSEGNIVFYHLYNNIQFLYNLEILGQNGLIVVGTDENEYPIVLRIDDDGNEIWSNNFEENTVPVPQGEHDINSFKSVVLNHNNEIIACGGAWNENEEQMDGVIVRLEPDHLDPIIFYWDPLDTVLTILPEDTLQFTVRARDQQGDELTYSWAVDDSVLVGNDTTKVIHFTEDLAELGEHIVRCAVSDEEWTSEVRWHITVDDFFIRETSPDSLRLLTRRGSTLPFTLDIACVEPDAPTVEWSAVNRDNQREYLGEADTVEICFDLAGEWAVEAEASWNGEQESVRWAVDVRSAVWWWMPHENAISVNRNERREFSVFPFDPDSDSLSVAWCLDGDSLESNAEALSLDFPELGEHSLTTIVRDGIEADTIHWQITVNDPGSVIDRNSIPVELALYPPAPNPFNSTTTIGYSLPAAIDVSLAVYDLSGREVARLVDGAKAVGVHEAVWKADGMASGVYVVSLDAGGVMLREKVVLVK